MEKNHLFPYSLFIIFLVLNFAISTDTKITGSWQGELKLPNQNLRILFHFSEDDNEQLIAKMDSPDQNAKNIPVSDVKFNEGEVILTIKSIGGMYIGKVQDGNQSIQGIWKQSGYEFPLNLKKIASEPVANSHDGLNKQSNRDSDIELETPTGSLFGTLEIPGNKPPFPVVLIIAGSGPTDRDGNNPTMQNNSLKMLAKELKINGIASLRYDKRGVGKSKNASLMESDLRFENYIEDAKHWINALKKDDRFGDIVVIGHSEGSLIGMAVSQNKIVSKFVSIAGCGQTADKIIKEQLKSQPPEVLEQALPILDKLTKGETVENVPQMLNPLFRPSVQPYMISWIKYDPQKEIAKLDKPILIIQGTTDIQVTIEDADRLAKSNPKAAKKIIDGMNHIMKESVLERQKNFSTYNQPDLPLNKELINIIVDFIKP